MPVTPTGPLSLPLANLRTLLAACEAWQGWIAEITGEPVDAAAAAERVHLVDLPAPADGSGAAYAVDELEELRPAAVVNWFVPQPGFSGSPHSAERVAFGQFVPRSKLTLRFEDEVPDEDAESPADALFRFSNRVGAVLSELLTLSGTDGYLVVDSVEVLVPFQRSDQTIEAQQGKRWEVCFLVNVGI